MLEIDLRYIYICIRKFPHPHLVNQNKLSNEKDIFAVCQVALLASMDMRNYLNKHTDLIYLFVSSPPLTNTPQGFISSQERIC